MKRKIILILIMLVCLCAVSHSCAFDDISHIEADDGETLEIEDDSIFASDVSGEDTSQSSAGSVHKLDSKNSTFSDIQKTIDAANDGDTIELNGTFIFEENDNAVKVNRTVTIVGSENGAVIQRSDLLLSTPQIFNIESSNVVLKNLKIITGSTLWAGNNGEVINCEFIKCRANNGGAVEITGTNCSLINSTFTNNNANNGGAVYWIGDKGSLINCTFKSNQAKESGGAVCWKGTNGIIANSTFEDNRATDDASYGGAVCLNSNNTLITRCDFTKNHCSDYGGAVSSFGLHNRIVECEFTGNYISNNLTTGQGGGAVYSNYYNLTIDNCRFKANRALQANGGAVRLIDFNMVKNSYFIDNLAVLGNDIHGSGYYCLYNFFQLDYNETKEDALCGYEFESNNTFNKTKINSVVIFKPGIVFNYGETGSIHVTVEGGTIEKANIRVLNHKEAKTDIKNNVIYVSNLDVGSYSLLVTTTPDENHTAVDKNITVTVKQAFANVKAEAVTVQLKNGKFKFKVKITDSRTGKAISSMKVTLKIKNGKKWKTLTKFTNSNGEVSVKTSDLKKGSHAVKISASHKGYKTVTAKSSIKVVKPIKLAFDAQEIELKHACKIEFKVYDKKTRKKLSGVKFNLFIKNGKKTKKISLISLSGKNKGFLSFTTNELSVGKHKVDLVPVSVKYSGHKIYHMTINKRQANSADYSSKR